MVMGMEMEMEMESQQFDQQLEENNNRDEGSKLIKRVLVVLNFAIMVVGSLGTPILLRVYFLHGGHRKWLSSWLQTAGWPLLLLPLIISYVNRRRQDRVTGGGGRSTTKLFFITPHLFAASAILGILTGLDDFFYAYGVSYLPVSTSAILISTQLGFTAFFAFLLVKQKFTPFSVNAVALLMFGAVILGIDSANDRAEGETGMQYYMGFFLTLAAALLFGVVMPLVELSYAKAKQAVTYTLVMEMQLVMGFFATAFCTIGMIVNKDFQVIPREAKEFGLGETKYYWLLAGAAILSQFFFLGTVGAIFYASALLAGVVNAALIPMTEVLAVIFFHEQFTGGKGISLALSLWGFTSYFYGEYKESKRNKISSRAGTLDSLTRV